MEKLTKRWGSLTSTAHPFFLLKNFNMEVKVNILYEDVYVSGFGFYGKLNSKLVNFFLNTCLGTRAPNWGEKASRRDITDVGENIFLNLVSNLRWISSLVVELVV